LSGEVELYEDSPAEAFRRIGGVPNVKVVVSGPRGFRRILITNAAAVYEVFGLPHGKRRSQRQLLCSRLTPNCQVACLARKVRA
jgi:hypothetical protein